MALALALAVTLALALGRAESWLGLWKEGLLSGWRVDQRDQSAENMDMDRCRLQPSSRQLRWAGGTGEPCAVLPATRRRISWEKQVEKASYTEAYQVYKAYQAYQVYQASKEISFAY